MSFVVSGGSGVAMSSKDIHSNNQSVVGLTLVDVLVDRVEIAPCSVATKLCVSGIRMQLEQAALRSAMPRIKGLLCSRTRNELE